MVTTILLFYLNIRVPISINNTHVEFDQHTLNGYIDIQL